MAKSKLATKKAYATSVVFTFEGGHTLTCDIGQLTPDMVMQLALHGIAQKVGDAYAGKDVGIAEAIANATGTWDNLMAGNWTTRSKGGILARAVADVMGVDLQDVIDQLEDMEDKDKRELRKDPRIAARILELQKPKGGKEVDLNALFAPKA